MQFQTPTITSLLAAALKAARDRFQLLLLLALLCGIVISQVYAPAMAVLKDLLLALEAGDSTGAARDEAAAVFEEGTPTLLFGQLATTAVVSFLVIPFARASAPGDLLPGAGGGAAFWVRGLRSFLHMVAASGIIMLMVLIAIPILAILSGLFGAIGSAIMLAGICLIVWATVAITGAAHLAVAAEARDRRETLPSAFVRARLFMPPIAGSLALIFLAMMVLDIILSTLVVALVPAAIQDTIALVFSGAVLFATSALHVAALYIVPDFRDLRPQG